MMDEELASPLHLYCLLEKDQRCSYRHRQVENPFNFCTRSQLTMVVNKKVSIFKK
jgi:hypothetical protein